MTRTGARDDPRRPDDELRELDQALSRLPEVDLPPLAARSQLAAARSRLAQSRPAAVWFERREPALLWVLSAAHLVWIVLRLL